jgi:biopolymer transport protein TolR
MSKELNEQKIVVTMDKNQRVYLGNDPVNVNDFSAKITAKMKKPNEGIFLRCDKTVPFGAFASLMDSLRQAGITNISIVTEPLPDKAKG